MISSIFISVECCIHSLKRIPLSSAAEYTDGIRLFEFDKDLNFKLLDHFAAAGCVEATPAVYNRKVYIASKNGNLYVLGEKNKPINPTRKRIEDSKKHIINGPWELLRKGLR